MKNHGRSIKRNSLIASVVTAATLATVSSAFAQADSSVYNRPYRVQLGLAFPSDSALRDATASTHFAYGLAYDLYKSQPGGTPILAGLYLDGTYGGGHGNNFFSDGLGVQGRIYFSQSSKLNPYFGAGVGWYYLHSDFNGSSDAGRLGGKAFIGAEIPQGVYLEVGYTLVDRVVGVSPGGLTTEIGYRF